MIELKALPDVRRNNPTEWMNLLWEVIWDYEECKQRNKEIKDEDNFQYLMDEVKTVMSWIEEDLEIEREEMYKTEDD